MKSVHAAPFLLAATWLGAPPLLAQVVGGGSDVNAGPAVTAVDGQGNVVNVSGGVSEPSPQSASVYTPFGFPQPGFDPDGHLPQSSRSLLDINGPRDGFDLARSRETETVVRGSATGEAILPEDLAAPGRARGTHQVKKGDTLWDLCATHYNNPWMWPKVWSYNPHIQNPHWIYPGDELTIRPSGPPAPGQSLTLGGMASDASAGMPFRRKLVPDDTVFLRTLGYIDDPRKDVWGELVGAHEEQMLLAEGNHVYLSMRPGVSLERGQKLTIFRPVRVPQNIKGARTPKGQIVSFKGTVEIDHWDPEARVARGTLVETIDVVERGSKVGPVGRRFDVIPPKPSDVDVWARVLTSIYPHEIIGQNQAVFIDRGKKDGLAAGNRLVVVQRGDMWRKTLATATKMARGRVRTDVPERVSIDYTPLHGDESAFPEEVVGEIRIVRARNDSSLAIVTASQREIEPGDRVVARKGY
jgi:hypothetical protein